MTPSSMLKWRDKAWDGKNVKDMKLEKADPEILDGLGRLKRSDAAKVLRCKRSAITQVIGKYSQDISCSGCVRTLKVALSLSLGEGSLMRNLFQESKDGELELHPLILNGGNELVARVFNTFNAPNVIRRGNNGKRQRCSLHTANPRVEQDWLEHWQQLSTEEQERVACIDVVDLSDALSEHLKDLYFCRDCRGNVLRALDMLVGYIDYEDLPLGEEFCDELFSPFWLTSDDHYLCDDDSEDEDDDDDDEHSVEDCQNVETKVPNKGTLSDTELLDVEIEFPVDLSIYTTSTNVENCEEPGKYGKYSNALYGKDSDDDQDDSYEKMVPYKGHHHIKSSDCRETHSHGHSHGRLHHADHEQDRSSKKTGYCDAASFVTESGSELSYCPEATHVACALYEVPALVSRAQEIDRDDELVRQSGQSSDRHAPTLRDGQNELLHCIGKLLLERIKSNWHLQLVREQTDELFVWLTLSCMRTNLQTELQGDKGNEALLLLLEEEDRLREVEEKKKTSKKKKKSQKKKKAAREKTSLVQPTLAGKSPPAPEPSHQGDNGWDQDAEARLMAQLCGQLPEYQQPSLSESDVSEQRKSSDLIHVEEVEDGALTAEEIQEAQLQLQAMMAKGSREQLRASLRKKFDNLCHGSSTNI